MSTSSQARSHFVNVHERKVSPLMAGVLFSFEPNVPAFRLFQQLLCFVSIFVPTVVSETALSPSHCVATSYVTTKLNYLASRKSRSLTRTIFQQMNSEQLISLPIYL